MKSIVWNCRGMGRPEFKSNFSYLCSLEKLDLFCVVETKISMDKAPTRFFRKFVLSVFWI